MRNKCNLKSIIYNFRCRKLENILINYVTKQLIGIIFLKPRIKELTLRKMYRDYRIIMFLGIYVCIKFSSPFKEAFNNSIWKRFKTDFSFFFKVGMDPISCVILELSMICTGGGVTCALEDTCCWAGLLYTVYNVYFFSRIFFKKRT